MMDRRFYCEEIVKNPKALFSHKLRDGTFEFCATADFAGDIERRRPNHDVGDLRNGWRYLFVDAKLTIEGKMNHASR